MRTTLRFGYRIAAFALLVFGWIGLNAIAEVDAERRDGGGPLVLAGSSIDAGRYLVIVGGCNDCHTANWLESAGGTPEDDWLTGAPIGFRGPWGTTYPSNLRLLVHEMDENAWVKMLRHRTDRPPMPWMNLNQLNEADARAIYKYIRSLGPRGERMPLAVDADVEPATPYILFEPLHLERLPVNQADTLPKP